MQLCLANFRSQIAAIIFMLSRNFNNRSDKNNVNGRTSKIPTLRDD